MYSMTARRSQSDSGVMIADHVMVSSSKIDTVLTQPFGSYVGKEEKEIQLVYLYRCLCAERQYTII